MSVMSMFASDLAIDLGTANTCVFAQGRGIVLNEPSIVAFNTAKGTVEAVGRRRTRCSGGRRPTSGRCGRCATGVIADFDAPRRCWSTSSEGDGPAAVAPAAPGHRGAVGNHPGRARAVRDSGFRVKASEVHLVDEPMAAAIGAGLPVTEAAGNMVIDIGGGTTDIAVISMAGTVYGRSLRVAGDAMDEAIISTCARLQPAHRRAHGAADQVRDRIGDAARRAARDGSEGPHVARACRGP
jgi:rod shape-determining protein MreB